MNKPQLIDDRNQVQLEVSSQPKKEKGLSAREHSAALCNVDHEKLVRFILFSQSSGTRGLNVHRPSQCCRRL